MDIEKIEELIKLTQKYDLRKLKVSDDEKGSVTIEMKSADNNVTYTREDPYFRPGMAAGAMIPTQSGISHAEPQQPTAASGEQKAADAPAKKLKEVRSPFVGTFYAAPSPGAEDFVYVGKKVKKGQALCIVEAMKLMNEIEADRDMVIAEILVENEEPIEYDQVLFLVE